MAKNKRDNGLIVAIIFASVIISASLTFFGMRLAGGDAGNMNLEEEIARGIDNYVANSQKAPTVNAEDFVDDDAVLGDKDAPVTIVEFSDYECPFCARFFQDTLPQLKKNYIDTGKVKMVYRDFPLSFHPAAMPAAIAGECAREQAGDEAYYKVHDHVFANQGSIPNQANAADYYGKLAKSFGVKDEAQLRKCIADEKYKAEANKDMQDGQKAGVSGTPGFIIGSQLLEGAQPYEAFVQAIEAELAK